MDKAKLWTNEGQPNNNPAFSRQKASLYSTHVLAFPFWESGEHPLPYPCFPLWGKCLRKQTIEVDSNFFIFPRLPLGGKLLAKQGDEGQPNNNQAFFQKAALYSTRVLGFPVGESGEHPLPYPCFPLRGKCLRKQTIEDRFLYCLFPRLPPGGKLLAKQGDEGQPNNNQAFFSSKSRFITNPHSCFPLRGKCLRKQTIEVDSNFFIFPRLPLGGKLLAKQGDEGQPNNIQAFFSSKSRLILKPHSRLPLRGSCRR